MLAPINASPMAGLSGQMANVRPNDHGVAASMGVGRGGKRLNSNALDLQDAIDDAREAYLEISSTFVDGIRHDYYRFGLLAEVVSKIPILVYDLPELVSLCDTAFVDSSGKMYIAANFARRLIAEHREGKQSLFFIFGHEASHLLRLHLARTHFDDLPVSLRMRSQDARINIDLVKALAAEQLADSGVHKFGLRSIEMEKIVKQVLNELSSTAVGVGVAMNWEDYQTYLEMSEEAVAMHMLHNLPQPDPIPNREVSFPLIMEGAALEVDAVKVMLQTGVWLAPSVPEASFTPAELSALSAGLRHIGQHKAHRSQVSDQEIQQCLDDLGRFTQHQGLLELDLRHERALQMSANGVHASGKTGDNYLDVLKPSERVSCAMDALRMLLQAKAGNSKQEQGGPSIKDLERSLGRGQDNKPDARQQQGANQQDGADKADADQKGEQPSAGKDAQSQGSEPGEQQQGAASTGQGQPGAPNGLQPSAGDGIAGDFVPFPSSHSADNHVISSEDLVKTLKGAGLSDSSLKKLGYDDIVAITGEQATTKTAMINAVNKAAADQKLLGSRYPGGHLLGYAQQQLQALSKPILTWQMAIRKMIEDAGRGNRMDEAEPWTVYHIDHRDMGLDSASDVPYLGSIVPGKAEPALIFNIYDVSGSVDDEMAARFVTEGINQCRAQGHGRSIESVHITADTIRRGEPKFITEKNYRQVLASGFTISGRGGTNLQASIESVFELVKPGAKPTPYSRRKIDAIAFWTDLGDKAPDPVRLLAKARACGLKRLPPIVFLAPRRCLDDSFNRSVSTWSTVVYFDDRMGKKQKVDLDAIARVQRVQAPGWEGSAPRPKG